MARTDWHAMDYDSGMSARWLRDSYRAPEAARRIAALTYAIGQIAPRGLSAPAMEAWRQSQERLSRDRPLHPTIPGAVWVQDLHLAEALYWQKRGEWDFEGTLEARIFAKAYLGRWWQLDRVWLGPPRGPRASGSIGIYARRAERKAPQ